MLDIEVQAEKTAQKLVADFSKKCLTLALAESCTAGLVSDLIARVSGASSVLWGSFVCYSPQAKERMLGIDPSFFGRHALVSRETAREMAVRTLEITGASAAAAVTGIAGPSGDGSGTPIGTVWVATALHRDGDRRQREKELHLIGTRAEVRVQAAKAVLEELLDAIR
jgi:PncC family amidohydrolase